MLAPTVLAVVCASHQRCGAKSPMRGVPHHLLRRIVDFLPVVRIAPTQGIIERVLSQSRIFVHLRKVNSAQKMCTVRLLVPPYEREITEISPLGFAVDPIRYDEYLSVTQDGATLVYGFTGKRPHSLSGFSGVCLYAKGASVGDFKIPRQSLNTVFNPEDIIGVRAKLLADLSSGFESDEELWRARINACNFRPTALRKELAEASPKFLDLARLVWDAVAVSSCTVEAETKIAAVLVSWCW